MINQNWKILSDKIKENNHLVNFLNKVWEKDHISSRAIKFLSDSVQAEFNELSGREDSEVVDFFFDIILHILLIHQTKSITEITDQELKKISYENFLTKYQHYTKENVRSKRLFSKIEEDSYIEFSEIDKILDILSHISEDFFNTLLSFVSEKRKPITSKTTLRERADAVVTQSNVVKTIKKHNEVEILSTPRRTTSPRRWMSKIDLGIENKTEVDTDNAKKIINFFDETFKEKEVIIYFQNFKKDLKAQWIHLQKETSSSPYSDTYSKINDYNDVVTTEIFTRDKNNIFADLSSEIKDGLIYFVKINIYFLTIIQDYIQEKEQLKKIKPSNSRSNTNSTSIDSESTIVVINNRFIEEDFLQHFQLRNIILPVLKNISKQIPIILKLNSLHRIKKISDIIIEGQIDSNFSEIKNILLQSKFKNYQFIINNENLNQFENLIDVTIDLWDKEQKDISEQINKFQNKYEIIVKQIDSNKDNLERKIKDVAADLTELNSQKEDLERKIHDLKKQKEERENEVQSLEGEKRGSVIKAFEAAIKNKKLLDEALSASKIQSGAISNHHNSKEKINTLIENWSEVVSNNVSSTKQELQKLIKTPHNE